MQESEIVATIHIPFVYLKSLYNRNDHAASSDRENRSYVQLLNSEIIGKSLITIDEICEREEWRLRRLASEEKTKYKIVKCGVPYQRLGYTKQLAVCELTHVYFFLTAVQIAGLMSRILAKLIIFWKHRVFSHHCVNYAFTI